MKIHRFVTTALFYNPIYRWYKHTVTINDNNSGISPDYSCVSSNCSFTTESLQTQPTLQAFITIQIHNFEHQSFIPLRLSLHSCGICCIQKRPKEGMLLSPLHCLSSKCSSQIHCKGVRFQVTHMYCEMYVSLDITDCVGVKL